MSISAILAAVSNAPRGSRYLAAVIAGAWNPAGGSNQTVVERELVSSMVHESELFLDRAIVLFLIRNRLRERQALTWGNVGVYYSNYFAACATLRLALNSITFVRHDVYVVKPTAPSYFEFKVMRSMPAASHARLWDLYYKTVTELAWPDTSTVSMLSPSGPPNRHRERIIREAINYTPGMGFLEIHESAGKYRTRWNHLRKLDLAVPSVDDSAYLDEMAYHRIKHCAGLAAQVEKAHLGDAAVIARRKERERLISRYASSSYDSSLLFSCFPTK